MPSTLLGMMIDIEKLTDQELDVIQGRYKEMREQSVKEDER
jgi:hypothetical protein